MKKFLFLLSMIVMATTSCTDSGSDDGFTDIPGQNNGNGTIPNKITCQPNEIMYTTKYDCIIEKEFVGKKGFGKTDATVCVESVYENDYGYIRFNNDVTQIPAGAFADCASLESIYLPDGIKTVGKNAFDGCYNLSAIISINSDERNNHKALIIDGCLYATALAGVEEYTVPAGVTKIASSAFSGNSHIKKVVIPEGVKEIEAGAFEDCENLRHLTIPNSLTIFGGHLFTGTCNNDITFEISYNHPSFTTYTTSDSQKLESLSRRDYIIINTLIDGVGYVLFTDNHIPYEAFRGYGNLTSVTVGNNVTSIGSYLFVDCINLTSVTIGDGISVIKSNVFSGRGLGNCLAKIVISNKVTTIEECAFESLRSLTNFTIPSSVTDIGYGAFRNCASLTSITIPNGVTDIERYTFEDCSSLANITIPNSVTSIDSYAFHNCTAISEITIPNSVTSIDSYAFKGCTSLVSVTMPKYLTRINEGIFRDCTSLKKITIPNNVAEIGRYAFYNCCGLTNIAIPDSVTKIEENAFVKCSSLTNISIPNSVTEIGNTAFYGCSSLTSINIPDGIKTINASTFYGCTSLSTITIPTSVTSIDAYAFYNCANLKEIYCKPTTPPALYSSDLYDVTDTFTNFDYSQFEGTIYVPRKSVYTYRTTAGWSSYSRKISGNDF